MDPTHNHNNTAPTSIVAPGPVVISSSPMVSTPTLSYLLFVESASDSLLPTLVAAATGSRITVAVPLSNTKQVIFLKLTNNN